MDYFRAIIEPIDADLSNITINRFRIYLYFILSKQITDNFCKFWGQRR